MKKHIAHPEWLLAWNATAIILWVRSLARDSPAVPSWQIVTVAFLIVTVASLARLMLHRNKRTLAKGDWTSLAITPGTVTFAFWLSTLGPSTIATTFLWTLLIAAELIWLIGDWRFSAFSSGWHAAVVNPSTQSDPDAPLADDVNSQIERRDPDGHEQFSGLLRVRYEKDQRHAAAFAGFVPPLRGTPTADAEVVWGDDATVKVIEIHAQGVRFEVSREGACDNEGSTIIEFFAQSSIEA